MIEGTSFPMAPEMQVSQWLNTPKPIYLADYIGKVVVIEAFQMLCPGCVSHGLPQAQQIYNVFPKDEVLVVGLHTVFEHHKAMTPVSLEAFIYEYGLSFPIGVDQSGTADIPKTMEKYRLRGTPSLVLIDKKGQVRANHFGKVSDMQIAHEITNLMHEASIFQYHERCTEEGCKPELD